MMSLNQSKTIYEKDWALLPYNLGKVKDKFLMVSLLGSWDLLTLDEYVQVSRLDLDKENKIFKRLKEKGLIIENKIDLARQIDDYRTTNLNLFTDIGLHIAVVTNKCNLRCRYCQTYNKRQNCMDKKTAAKILEFVFQGKNTKPGIEFQGGEPLLNFEIIKYFVKYARKYNKTKKEINLSLVSNFSLLDRKKLNFLIDNNVNLCVSLDGPKWLHDKNRISSQKESNYDQVIYWFNQIKKEYRKRDICKSVGALPTITKDTLGNYKELIDEYVRNGVNSIALRPVNRVGIAQKTWRQIGYTPDKFIDFWKKSLDYILKLNKKGINIRERMASVMASKILSNWDPGYVDLCSPCGAGRSVLAYSPEGDVYTCDEARMVGEDLFKLGNVFKNSYQQILNSPVCAEVCQASLLDFWQYDSPYKAWGGTCPVLNYIEQGSPIVKVAQSSFHKIQKGQFTYLFEKIDESKKNLEIFKKWIN